jgi:hypothetical protein
MFDPTSRYYNVETAYYTTPEGKVLPHKRRRLIPPGGNLPLMQETSLQAGERLDLLAYRTLGNPEAYWRICDANTVIDPHELEKDRDRLLRIPVPQY